jgi:hypothetical protein
VRLTPGNFIYWSILLAIGLFLAFPLASSHSASMEYPSGQNWTNYVRIAAFPLEHNDPDKIVQEAAKDHVFGIEADNDITGRYESFLDPNAKLAEIRAVAEKAHKVDSTYHGQRPPRLAAKKHRRQASCFWRWQRVLDQAGR